MSVSDIFKPGGGENTSFHYMYRDADNYKTSKTIILAGKVTADQVKKMVDSFSDSEFFLPDQVGLPSLTGQFEHGRGWDEDSDHPWHTIEEITHTDAPAEYGLDDIMAHWPETSDGWNGVESEETLKASMPHI